MANKESSSFSIKADDASIFNTDENFFSYNKELDKYLNTHAPEVAKGEVVSSDLMLQNNALRTSNTIKYISFNTFDFGKSDKSRLNRLSHSDGENLTSFSDGGYDFEQDSKSKNDFLSYGSEEISTSRRCLFENSPMKERIIENVISENKELLHGQPIDLQKEHDTINPVTRLRDAYEKSNDILEFREIEKGLPYNSENEEYLESEMSNSTMQNCYNFSNVVTNDFKSCRNHFRNVRNDAKEEVELRHNECALTNEFFETVENINLKISEKQNNLKEAAERLMTSVNKSNLENRINALVELSDKNLESIEQFKKKSEDCIRQCRKFETTSENLIGECINTLSQASVCYADWVCLHSSDLKQIDADLANLQLFIETNQTNTPL